MNFPDGANGDALRRLEAQGDDLSKSRDIEFTVVFANEDAARQFVNHFSTLGYPASAEFTQTDRDYPWDVIVVKRMLPSHGEIGAFEGTLQSVAARLGGHNDGWGCFSEH